MGKSEIREPTQKRSIEKKEKIIKYGFKLICEKGFHGTNTAEIAKASGVSTGIVYQYFKDKRDIFLQGIEQYAKSMMFPINDIINKQINKEDLYNEFKNFIDLFVKNHKISQSAHQQIVALQHSDSDVAEIFNKYELDTTNKLAEILEKNNIVSENLKEKAHLIVSMMDNLCHELVYHKHEDMDYDAMTNIVINTIIYLLN